MLFCGDVYGQWGAGDWPTTDKYFRGRQRLLQVRSGIVERATAANVSTNGIKPAGFFVQRSALTNYKHFIQASLVPEYVHSGTTNAAGNFYSSNDLQAVTFWTASNILADVGAPTNYFDSTPYFNLSSVSNGWMFMRDIVDRLKWTTTEDYVYVYSQKWGDTFCAITTNVCYIDQRLRDFGVDGRCCGWVCHHKLLDQLRLAYKRWRLRGGVTAP